MELLKRHKSELALLIKNENKANIDYMHYRYDVYIDSQLEKKKQQRIKFKKYVKLYKERKEKLKLIKEIAKKTINLFETVNNFKTSLLLLRKNPIKILNMDKL